MDHPRSLIAAVAVAVAGTALIVAAGALVPADEVPLAAAGEREPRPWETIIDDWEDDARGAVERLVRRYGEPHVAVPTMLVWYDNAPWKRTIVHRDGDRHEFPRAHRDVVEQVVDYRMPPDRLADLVEFDGSLSYARTAGELIVRGEDERLNILTVNLANELVDGRLDVGEARRALAEKTSKLLQKKRVPQAERLEFVVIPGGTADPDHPYQPASEPSARSTP